MGEGEPRGSMWVSGGSWRGAAGLWVYGCERAEVVLEERSGLVVERGSQVRGEEKARLDL